MQNLWWYNANYINRSINGDQFDENYKIGIVQALQNKDEASSGKRPRKSSMPLSGTRAINIKDYDHDGNFDNAGDGYGSLPNGNSPGYLQANILNTKNAIDAPDSTPNIRLNGENVQICVKNVTDWTEQLLDACAAAQRGALRPKHGADRYADLHTWKYSPQGRRCKQKWAI